MVRLLIVAQTPPPRHGQSIMTARMLELLDREPFPGVFHVEAINLRLSDSLEEIGHFSLYKAWRTLGFLLRLVAARLRGRIDLLYYVPATGLRSQIVRDWLVFGLARILAGKTILHWHGLGLREFHETQLTPVERWITRLTYKNHNLSLILRPAFRPEVLWLEPRAIDTLSNFLPDPCRDQAQDILAARAQRSRHRAIPGSAPDLAVLFAGHCTRAKGLFDSMDAVALANADLAARGVSWRIRLSVAGEFPDSREREEFDRRISNQDLRFVSGECAVTYCGYVEDEAKRRLFEHSDLLCLPTYFHTEAQPVVLIEALAFGLQIIVSDWRALPEMLPDSAFVVPRQSPAQIAAAMLNAATLDFGPQHRRYFLENYAEAAASRHLFALLRSIAGIQEAHLPSH